MVPIESAATGEGIVDSVVLQGSADETSLLAHRRQNGKAAIIFIHGFSGDPSRTWGDFPRFLANDSHTTGWDLYSLGYPTQLRLDLVGLWSADPPLQSLADRLRTVARLAPLDRYSALALVAHSMGGLVVQRALLDDDRFTGRVTHVFLFGTPSGGLSKAGLFARLKRQLANMKAEGEFITALRRAWDDKFRDGYPFTFMPTAGESDEFVPRNSSIDVFPKNFSVIPGNHLQIVKPEKDTNPAVQLVLTGLRNTSPANSADAAAELVAFREIVQKLETGKGALDGPHTVKLAIALERIGREKDAFALLEQAVERLAREGQTHTDTIGVLAGRLKRRWELEGRKTDGTQARNLYADALTLAEQQSNWEQAYYHGINVAFLELAYREDRQSARQMATKVLEYCAKAQIDEIPASRMWRLATEGEASLLLGNFSHALQLYREAIQAASSPWQRASMYQQATFIVGLIGDQPFAEKLATVFREGCV